MREQDGLKFLEYGNPAGKTVTYFTAPGAPEECSFFDQYARIHDLNIICYDRFYIDSKLQNQAYYQYLSKLIIERSGGRKIDLIGFSIGCHAAIETVHHLQTNVRELHLVSPTAPLDAAYFLNGMTGKMIFSLAMNRSFFLRYYLISKPFWQK
jgi:pimeloyl-ACP methyl ester carboxylesterase